MTTKNFNVKRGLNTGNAFLTGNIVVNRVGSNLVPNSNANLNLGSSLLRYKDLYLANVVDINGQQITANATHVEITGILTVATIETEDVTANSINANTITVNNELIINSTTDATSTGTGSITTAGGVGIQKDLYVGGSINLVNGQGDQTKKGIINYNDGVESIDFKFNR